MALLPVPPDRSSPNPPPGRHQRASTRTKQEAECSSGPVCHGAGIPPFPQWACDSGGIFMELKSSQILLPADNEHSCIPMLIFRYQRVFSYLKAIALMRNLSSALTNLSLVNISVLKFC